MITPSQSSLIPLKRYFLFVMFICIFPHIVAQPWWLLIIFLVVASYLLIADYAGYPLLPKWLRFLFFIGCVLLLGTYLHADGFLVLVLVTLIVLKCLEIQSTRDLRVMILCNFLLIFSALILIQELWMIIYLLIALFANLSLMLRFSSKEVSLIQIGNKSGQLLFIAIPLSIILFYVFPRIDPLWQVPSLSKGKIGFSETMNLGSIDQLFSDDSQLMQITFNTIPILNGYWRGIILSHYDGLSWNPSQYSYSSFSPLHAMKPNELADYSILLEPTQTKWLFYIGNPIAGNQSLFYSPQHGLIRFNNNPMQRFVYSLKIDSVSNPIADQTELAEATQLPPGIDPRLHYWALEHFANVHSNTKAFIDFLRNYIHQQPFWYTLTPPPINADRNQMDSFWFDTKKGFCEHYASAVAVILRIVGIPARVVVGFQGGQWNPITNTIMIQQNNAHAWLEYWQDGIGWKQLDPTTFIAPERIDQTIRNFQKNEIISDGYLDASDLPLAKEVIYLYDAVKFFSERWFLFYNQDTQRNLLGHWSTDQLWQATVGCTMFIFILLGFVYPWWQRQKQDALLVEYRLLQKEFNRYHVATYPSATLQQQCQSLAYHVPAFAPMLTSFIQHYEKLRLMQSNPDSKRETIILFKSLRKKVKNSVITKQ